MSTFTLDAAAFDARLAPAEAAGLLPDALPMIELPLQDGSLARFRVEESPALAPALQQRFP